MEDGGAFLPLQAEIQARGRPRRLPLALDIRHLLTVTVAAVYVLVVLGGVVRATGASLACPDWPLCGDSILPPLERLVLIEYAHRVLAALVGVLVLASAGVALWRHRHRRALVVGAVAAVPLVVAQALIGREAVEQEMPAPLRAAHLAMALLTLASLIMATVDAWHMYRSRWVVGPVVAALGVLALNLMGSFVANLGAGLAYGDWPLFGGKLVPSSHHLGQLHYAHRLFAAALGIGLVALVWHVRRYGGWAMGLGLLALLLYLAQVMVGAANVWLRLATPARVAHLALAAAVWGVLVVMALGNPPPVSQERGAARAKRLIANR